MGGRYAIRAAHDIVGRRYFGIIPGCRTAQRRRAKLPDAPHHHHRALPGRRPERRADPHPGRADENRARPDHHRRERHRRRRQHRRRPRRALGAGRLHARHRPQPDPRHQWRVDEPALRRGEGFRADVADRRHAAMADQPQDPAGQRREGADRLAQGATRRPPARSASAARPISRRCRSRSRPARTFQFVPYRGGAPLLQDLLAGQIDIAFGQAANYLAQVRSGQLKAFAVLSKQRWWAAPDVPTMDEAGVPGLHASFWHGLWAPKGTPKDDHRQARRRHRSRRWPTRRCSSA